MTCVISFPAGSRMFWCIRRMKHKKDAFKAWSSHAESVFYFRRKGLRAAQMSRVLLALLCSALLCSALLCSAVSVWHQIQSLSTPDFQKASGFFDEKSRGMYSKHPGEKQWQNLAVSNRLTRLASVALRRRFAPGLLYSFRWLDYSILPAKSKMFAASYIILPYN